MIGTLKEGACENLIVKYMDVIPAIPKVGLFFYRESPPARPAFLIWRRGASSSEGSFKKGARSCDTGGGCWPRQGWQSGCGLRNGKITPRAGTGPFSETTGGHVGGWATIWGKRRRLRRGGAERFRSPPRHWSLHGKANWARLLREGASPRVRPMSDPGIGFFP